MADTRDGSGRPIPVGPELIEIIRIAFAAKLCVMVEGETGIGKSEIVKAAAAALGVRVVVLDLSLLEPTDLLGMPRIEDEWTTYAPPGNLPREGCGILLLEELNRADPAVLAPALQLLTDRTLGDYTLPEGWMMIAAINPDDGSYLVNRLDPAMRRRFMQLRVVADLPSWIAWARTHAVHPAILGLAEKDDGFFSDVPPRSWAYSSTALSAMSAEQRANDDFAAMLLGGYLPAPWVKLVLEENARYDADARVDSRQLLLPLRDARHALQVIERLRKEGRMDCLRRIYADLYEIVAGAELGRAIESEEFHLETFELALAELPGDLRDNLQIAFAENPHSLALLKLSPEGVLAGYQGGMRTRVRGWLAHGRRKHRAMAVVAGLRAHLGYAVVVEQLRGDAAGLKRLAAFIRDVGEDGVAAPLVEDLKCSSIPPWGIH